MLTPQQAKMIVHESIQKILNQSVYIDPTDRLADVGVDGPRLYSLSDLISLEAERIGYTLDTLMIRGHLHPNLRISDLLHLVQMRALSLTPTPGRPGPISTEIYVCPQGDFVWARYSAGIPVPKCPHDGNSLVKK